MAKYYEKVPQGGYYKQPNRPKQNSSIASYYSKSKANANKKMIKLSLLKKTKNFINLSKNVAPSTSRTDRFHKQHKRQKASLNPKLNKQQSPSFQKDQMSFDHQQFVQGVRFVTLNPPEKVIAFPNNPLIKAF